MVVSPLTCEANTWPGDVDTLGTGRAIIKTGKTLQKNGQKGAKTRKTGLRELQKGPQNAFKNGEKALNSGDFRSTVPVCIVRSIATVNASHQTTYWPQDRTSTRSPSLFKPVNDGGNAKCRQMAVKLACTLYDCCAV
jgi:hypothetical protein